jgi:hypothetical protein
LTEISVRYFEHQNMNHINHIIQAKIDFLKWYLSVNSSEIYGKFRVFGPKKIKKIDFSLYYTILFMNLYEFMNTFYQKTF